jgi:tRNA-binding EMAP/Myf-like protein
MVQAELTGIESNGMVLAASSESRKPTLVTVDQPVAPLVRPLKRTPGLIFRKS